MASLVLHGGFCAKNTVPIIIHLSPWWVLTIHTYGTCVQYDRTLLRLAEQNKHIAHLVWLPTATERRSEVATRASHRRET